MPSTSHVMRLGTDILLFSIMPRQLLPILDEMRKQMEMNGFNQAVIR